MVIKNVASKVAWVGRTASMVFGLALVMALLFGVASMAMSATGQPFILGKENTAGQVSKLINEGAGAALRLEVQDGQPPLRVNSSTKVVNLNSDLLDGKSSTEFYAAGSQVADSLHADSADSATNATNANLLDNKDSTDFAAAYKSTVVVSPVGTDTQNGTALLNALSGITDASATNPYLLYIEPGTYDLGTDSLQMQQYVDIQGSGELSTLITSGYSDVSCWHGTVAGADDAELRFLTVTNTGTNCSVAVFNNSASPRLTHMTAEAMGESGNMGIFNTNANPTMTNVTATGSGKSENWGVYSDNGSSPTIKESTLSGGTSLYQFGSTAKVADTQLVGGVAEELGADVQCFNNYDENMNAVSC